MRHAITLLPPILVLVLFAGGVRGEEPWLFDVHSHTARGIDLERVIRVMDAAGVRRVVLFARRGGEDEEVLALAARHPGRVVPAIGFQNPGWLMQQPGFLDGVETKLKGGRYAWMGELLLRHYGVPELQAAEFRISPDSDMFRRTLDLSARYGVPVTIHHEAEPGTIELFRRALAHNREAFVVWAHWCGRAEPETVRVFLREFPNLYCDLGALDAGRRYGREKNPVVDRDGRMRAAWRALIEAYPDRFLAAIDAVDPRHYKRYVEWVAALKQTLTDLSPELRERLAHGNAERLLARRKQPE